MPRIIVTTDPVSSQLTDQTPVLLDEQVDSVHLSTNHAAAQLMERLAWAVRDAETSQPLQPRLRRDRPPRKSKLNGSSRPERAGRAAGRPRGVVAA
jgi:hypothetical protein